MKSFDVERLLQDTHIYLDSSLMERAGRLEVAGSTIWLGLEKIKYLTTHEGSLCCCVNNWLNNLPPEEKKSGELSRLRIMQAYENDSALLDLSHLGLRSLPPGALGQLSQLRVLDLRGNLLTTLAGSEIAGLKQLQYLYLSDNLLTSVEELRGIFWFRKLDLRNNPNLTDLTPLQNFFEKEAFNPENLPCSSQSEQAKRPRLSYSVVSKEPGQIRDLNNPSFADLEFQQEFFKSKRGKFNFIKPIERVEQDIQNHPHATPRERSRRLRISVALIYRLLRKIDESGIPKILHHRTGGWLNRQPEEERAGGRLFLLRSMQLYRDRFFNEKATQLNLSQLSLSSLPVEALGLLRWLRILDLSNNSIDTLVGSGISELGKLQYLDLSGNLLANLAGGGFTGLWKLQILNLSSNLLTNVEELSEMCWLKELNLANNPTLIDRTPLQNFPESTLNQSWIDVTELSSQIRSASDLKPLEISSEELDSLDVVESRTVISRSPEITPPGSNSHNLLPDNGQGYPVNEPPLGANLNAAVVSGIAMWEGRESSRDRGPSIDELPIGKNFKAAPLLCSTVGSENWRAWGSQEYR